MKKVLVIYFTTGGITEKMAEYIAEGIRISGGKATVKSVADIRAAADISGYDGYIIGSPTFSLDVPAPVKKFLDLAGKAGLEGKMAGAFGPYTHDVGYQHDSHAPTIVLDALQRDAGMKPFELGPFALKEDVVAKGEGLKACHDYGRIFGEKLGA
jgi:flavodoxin